MFGPEPTLKVASSFNPVLVAMGGTPAEEVPSLSNKTSRANMREDALARSSLVPRPGRGPAHSVTLWVMNAESLAAQRNGTRKKQKQSPSLMASKPQIPSCAELVRGSLESPRKHYADVDLDLDPGSWILADRPSAPGVAHPIKGA